MPYQLHCVDPLQVDDALLVLVLTTEFELELFTELDVEAGVELEVTLEDDVLLALEVLLETELLVVLLLASVEQTAPVTIGFSATPPLVSPCTPKLTDWPG